MRRLLLPALLGLLTGLMLGLLSLYWLLSHHALSLDDLPGGARSWYPLLVLWPARLQLLRVSALATVLAQGALGLWLLESSGLLGWMLAVRARRVEALEAPVARYGLLAFLAGSLVGTVVQHLGLGLDSLEVLGNARSIVFKLLAGGLLLYAALAAYRSPSWRRQVARPTAALGIGLALSLVPWQGFLEPYLFGPPAVALGPWLYLLWTAAWMTTVSVLLARLSLASRR